MEQKKGIMGPVYHEVSPGVHADCLILLPLGFLATDSLA